jgi:hypothetical protein
MEKGKSVIVNERPAVIIELGSLFTKVGISGDVIPKRIFYTPVSLRKWILTRENPETVQIY